MSEQDKHKSETLNPEELFRPLDDVCKDAKPLEPLWGFFLYKKAITSLIADPGAGKTTMGYKMGIQLCRNEPFLGIHPEEPVKCLMMDLESSDALVKSRKILVHGDEASPGMWIYNAVDYYFPQIQQVTCDFVIKHDINLVIMDNQTIAFATHDENDNSEAAKQMKLLRMWVNACNVAMILVHHTSKSNAPGTRKGTGAYARARLADILINLECPDEDQPDIVRWSVSKNRMMDDKPVWWLKKDEGNFVFVDSPVLTTVKNTGTLIYKAQKSVLEILKGQDEFKFGELVNAAMKDNEKTQMTVDIVNNAIHKLYQSGRIIKPKYGYWRIR